MINAWDKFDQTQVGSTYALKQNDKKKEKNDTQ